MEKHEPPRSQADSSLPRPIVLRPEDLANVAAAGASLAVMPSALSKVIIAGGFPAGPYLSVGPVGF